MSRSRIAWPSPIGGGKHGDDGADPAFVGIAEAAVQLVGVDDQVVGEVEDLAVRCPGPQRDGIVAVVDESHGATGGVVRRQHPAGPARAGGACDVAVEQAHDVLRRDAAGAQDLWRIDRAVHDRALHADEAGPAVEDHVPGRVQRGAEVVQDMGSRWSG